MSKRLGLIVRADDTGLGNQTWEMYQHLKPEKVMVILINNSRSLSQHPERYPDAWRVVQGIPTERDCNDFAQGLGTVFTCESIYNERILQIARLRKIDTVIQYNLEFLDYLSSPRRPWPDVLAAPSPWRIQEVIAQSRKHTRLTKVINLPVPVDRQKLPFRRIAEAKRFLHIIGRPAVHDRNGTEIMVEALKHITAKGVEFYFYTQDENYAAVLNKTIRDQIHNPNITVEIFGGSVPNYAALYDLGDVLVMPRRFGGLCLPMQEALSTGMPVLMPQCDPNNKALPYDWLLPCQITGQFQARTVVGLHSVYPQVLAEKIDYFAGLPAERMLEENQRANALAEALSWDNLLPMYEKVLR